MESRKITVLNTRTQSSSIINSSAATLGELKEDLRNAGIVIDDDMSFIEGYTKTKLVADDSILPTNINVRGTVTNDLMIALTNSNKKIKSGVDRKDLYNYIKENNLGEEIKKVFGKSYTNVSTAELESFLEPKIENPIEEDEEDENNSEVNELGKAIMQMEEAFSVIKKFLIKPTQDVTYEEGIKEFEGLF